MNCILKLTAIAVTLLCCAFASASDFESLVGDLNGKNYSAKRKAIEKIREVDDPRTVKTLQAMSDGLLFEYKQTPDQPQRRKYVRYRLD